ncbi:MAG: hypothetical protein CM15mP128_2500 [Methanobacteriota archaeon]|nr:MAG: hypothetical protein CM15mP128_2500 [Euryarchaeota archaeon]
MWFFQPCGTSAANLGAFASVNILTDRRAIPAVCEWSDFPTMPQIFVHGELIGGSDIVLRCFRTEASGRCSTKAVKPECSIFNPQPFVFGG